MADGYNIKVGLDSRSAERGVKSFTGSLNDSLKALRDFDSKARNAFKALDQFGKVNTGNLTRSMQSISRAVDIVNKLKVNTAAVKNLQAMGKALAGIKFSGSTSLGKLPAALKELDKIKINSKLVGDLAALKTSMKGFSSPPKSLGDWPKALNSLGKVVINPSLAKQLAAIKTAMKGFVGPARSALAIPTFLKGLSAHSINPSLARGLAAMKGAMAGMSGPSAASVRNIAALLNALKTTTASQINGVVNALAKLNGISIKLGGALGRAGTGMSNFSKQSRASTASMHQMYQASMAVHSALSMLQAVMGGASITSFAKSIYETGSAYQSLLRTLITVASSREEVASNLQFINDLTSKMPISLEVATESFKKFAAAARLSGVSAEDTQKVFSGFSMGFAAMGVDAEHSRHAFMALEQIFSKGTVTSEELKQQLGEHLPGAVSILADALGITTQKMFKMMEQGELTSDSIIKMASAMDTKFAKAASAASNSSQGALMSMANEWTRIQKIIFNSGFESGLGALARSISDILKSEEMKTFAADIGEAFNRLFRVIAVGAKVLAQNKDTVMGFLKAFAGWAAIGAAAGALRMFLIPLMLIAPFATAAGVAFTGLRTAMVALSAANIIKTFSNLASAFSGLASKVTIAAAGIILFAAGIDALFNDSKATNAIVEGVGKTFESLYGILKKSMPDIKLGDQIAEANKEFEKANELVKESNEQLNSLDSDGYAKNAAAAKKAAFEKEHALTNEEQKLWDTLNPLAAATAEYEKQLILIDQIAKKRGLDAGVIAQQKATLAAQTLDDRNPVLSGVQDMQNQLNAAKAVTAEQKAQNEALLYQQEMLKKGVVVTEEMKKAVFDFHMGLSKIAGESGNGFERWAASVKDWNDSMQDAIKDGISGLSDELTNFVSGAEYDFRALAQSILKSFIKIQIDSFMKDAMSGLGLNGTTNGADQAQSALAALSKMGGTIQTATTNVYTSGLNINGQPLTPASDIKAMGDNTGLRPALDANGNSTFNPTVAKSATDMQLRPALPVNPNVMNTDTGLRTGLNVNGQSTTNDFSKTVTTNDRDITFTPDAQAWKDQAVAAEEARAAAAKANPVSPDTMLRPGLDSATTAGITPPLGLKPWVDPALVPPANLTGKTLELSATDVENMKKTLATEWVSKAGEDQGKGILDTMMNRQMSGKWGDDMKSVVDARKQFSDINGPIAWKQGRNSVDDLEPGVNLSQSAYNRSSALTDKYLAERASGTPSIVGDNLNYANPTYSDAKNRPWIEALDGPKLGTNRSNTHYHGTTPELEKYRPGEFDVKYPGQTDPTMTNSIPGQATDLKSADAALNQSMPSLDKFKTSITDMGVKTQTAATQQQTALQTTTSANQTNAMAQQQVATSTQMAGVNAQQAGPQFQQAGQSIQQAGQNAQTAGTQAQTSTTGLSSMTSGLGSMTGQLSSAIPSLSGFSQALSMLGSLGSPTASAGLFKEGGYAGSPVSTGSMSAGAWANAPHYAEGTANTSGGMPAILHDNEAVIPLSRGREIPVKFDSTDRDPAATEFGSVQQGRGGAVFNLNLHGVKNGDDFKKSRRQVQTAMADGYERSLRRNG